MVNGYDSSKDIPNILFILNMKQRKMALEKIIRTYWNNEEKQARYFRR